MARILYFGIARDIAGTDSEELALGGDATVEGLWSLLIDRHPKLDRIRSMSRLAVDMVYAGDDVAVRDDAEIAIIPPVAGG